MKKIKIITSTTREGRKGIAIAKWMEAFSRRNGQYDVELLDLAEINLPMMNEPNHPRLRQYQYDHTKAWSAKIDEADAFIIILAEYNFGYPAPIKNAIDYLFQEWQYKPVAFVSYGGVSGGLRATQMLKQVVTTLRMVPIVEQVNIPFFTKMIGEDGVFNAEDIIEKSAEGMMKELTRWIDLLAAMRGKEG